MENILLNTKDILECEEDEIDQHNKEIENVFNALGKYKNYKCAVIIKYFDEANKNKEPIIKECNLYDCQDMLQYVDCKNGINLQIVDNFLTIVAYGQMYRYKNNDYIVTTGIQIRPYDTFDGERDFVNLFIN